MIHPTSLLLNSKLSTIERFHGTLVDIEECETEGFRSESRDIVLDSCSTSKRKLKVFSNNAINNYGTLLSILPKIIPSIYVNTDKIEDSDICNKNTGQVGWYIDNMENFILKENLVESSSYSIKSLESKDVRNSEDHEEPLYISKPSHLYVGSGKYIMIGTYNQVKKRHQEKYKGEILKWIIQPLLTNIVLWHDRYKFDLRLFATIFTYDNSFYAACYKIGIGRVCVNPHDPVNDPLSAITNISVQEKVPGYDPEFHLPLIYDDKEIGKTIIADILEKVELKLDPRKKVQILILGLDIIFTSDGKYKLIEVNHNPSLEYRDEVNNNEKTASLGFIMGLYGKIIPNILNGVEPEEIEDWDFV